MSAESHYYLYTWSDIATLGPALVRAQHSDKESIVELLRDFSIKSNRSYSEFCLFQPPNRKAVPSRKLLRAAREIGEGAGMEVDQEDKVSVGINYLVAEREFSDLAVFRHNPATKALLLHWIQTMSTSRKPSWICWPAKTFTGGTSKWQSVSDTGTTGSFSVVL